MQEDWFDRDPYPTIPTRAALESIYQVEGFNDSEGSEAFESFLSSMYGDQGDFVHEPADNGHDDDDYHPPSDEGEGQSD